MNIAFWSNTNGDSATSGNMVAVGTMASVLYTLRTVLVQTDMNSRALDEVLDERESSDELRENCYYYSSRGMDELLMKYFAGKLDTDAVRENIVNIRNTNLCYVPTAKLDRYQPIDKLRGLKQIMNRMSQTERLCFWDLSNGINNLSMRLLGKSDVIVVNINQNTKKQCIDEFLKIHFKKEMSKKVVYIVGRYDDNSKIKLSYIMDKYRIPACEIGVIPYNIEFHDALVEGRVVEFIMENLFVKEFDKNFEFMDKLCQTTSMILGKAGIDNIM